MRLSMGAPRTGMIAFTSGVMLGIFALSNPLSVEATEAKRGIGRIISMPSTPGYKAALWAQSSRVLEGLLRLILEEEVKALVEADGWLEGLLEQK